MLHCNMNASPASALQEELDDILGGLHYARRREDLGRLALLTYWEVRRWARVARQERLAAHAAEVITEHPHASRGEFLAIVDDVIRELESLRRRLH
jgi:hypothetical protein